METDAVVMTGRCRDGRWDSRGWVIEVVGVVGRRGKIRHRRRGWGHIKHAVHRHALWRHMISSAGLSHLHSGRTCCSGLLLLLVTLGGTADYDADEDGQTDHCSYHNACYLTGLSRPIRVLAQVGPCRWCVAVLAAAIWNKREEYCPPKTPFHFFI